MIGAGVLLGLGHPLKVLIGKRRTLLRPGALGRGELLLDWPDQGTAERNWAVNSLLLDRAIAAGASIRDAEVERGRLRSDTGFLARERAQMRAAGLRPGVDGYWTRRARRSLVPLAPVWLARAARAAVAGAATFAVPEAAPIAAWIAVRAPDPGLRLEAAAWTARGAGYHDLIRLCARAALALDAGVFTPVFRAKVADELEPMLALWPHALLMPTTRRLRQVDLICLRAFPVHPIGLVAGPSFADGTWLSPSEYFFHDLDHARYKVREDLRLRGLRVPDPYQRGSTLDPPTGRHRGVLAGIADQIAAGGAWPADHARARHRRVNRLLARARSHRDAATAQAAELLLFEILHEKSTPLDAAALARAFHDDAHLAKLWRKQAAGFFGADAPGVRVLDALPAARAGFAELGA